MKHIIITNKFIPTKFQVKLINTIVKSIKQSKYWSHYDFTYHTQKYTCKDIITHIIYYLFECSKFKQLGNRWNNIYKHFQQLLKWNIIKDTYTNTLKQYLIKTNYKTLNFVSCDSTGIVNRNGTDCIGRNSYFKNKNCTKYTTLIDKHKIPIHYEFMSGNRNDIIYMNNNLDSILTNYGKYIKVLCCDAAYYSKNVIEICNNHNIKYLIPKNIKNSKKYLNEDGTKKTKAEKLMIQFEDFTKLDKKLYNKRMGSEHYFSTYKNTNSNKFRIRNDKHITSLDGYTILYNMCSMMKYL